MKEKYLNVDQVLAKLEKTTRLSGVEGLDRQYDDLQNYSGMERVDRADKLIKAREEIRTSLLDKAKPFLVDFRQKAQTSSQLIEQPEEKPDPDMETPSLSKFTIDEKNYVVKFGDLEFDFSISEIDKADFAVLAFLGKNPGKEVPVQEVDDIARANGSTELHPGSASINSLAGDFKTDPKNPQIFTRIGKGKELKYRFDAQAEFKKDTAVELAEEDKINANEAKSFVRALIAHDGIEITSRGQTLFPFSLEEVKAICEEIKQLRTPHRSLTLKELRASISEERKEAIEKVAKIIDRPEVVGKQITPVRDLLSWIIDHELERFHGKFPQFLSETPQRLVGTSGGGVVDPSTTKRIWELPNGHQAQESAPKVTVAPAPNLDEIANHSLVQTPTTAVENPAPTPAEIDELLQEPQTPDLSEQEVELKSEEEEPDLEIPTISQFDLELGLAEEKEEAEEDLVPPEIPAVFDEHQAIPAEPESRRASTSALERRDPELEKNIEPVSKLPKLTLTD